jgi:hypothetical protein
MSDKDVFLFMQKTFSDFGQEEIIRIFSSAIGNSHALEYNHIKMAF